MKDLLRAAQVSHGSISQNPSQTGTGSRVETPYGYEELLDLWIWLGFRGVSALSPNSMQGIVMLKKPPRVRDNNGALQVRLRLDGRDHFINRLGRFDDPVDQARGQAICAEIWRDAQQGDFDLTLTCTYCFYSKIMHITKMPSTNVSFNWREVNALHQMGEALMRKIRLTMFGCHKVAMEYFTLSTSKANEY